MSHGPLGPRGSRLSSPPDEAVQAKAPSDVERPPSAEIGYLLTEARGGAHLAALPRGLAPIAPRFRLGRRSRGRSRLGLRRVVLPTHLDRPGSDRRRRSTPLGR
jgi:hypothetical protein